MLDFSVNIALLVTFVITGGITLWALNKTGSRAGFTVYLAVFVLFLSYIAVYAGNSFLIGYLRPIFDISGGIYLSQQAAPFNAATPYIDLSFAALILFSLFLTASALWSFLRVVNAVRTRIDARRKRLRPIAAHRSFSPLPRKIFATRTFIYRFCRLNC